MASLRVSLSVRFEMGSGIRRLNVGQPRHSRHSVTGDSNWRSGHRQTRSRFFDGWPMGILNSYGGAMPVRFHPSWNAQGNNNVDPTLNQADILDIIRRASDSIVNVQPAPAREAILRVRANLNTVTVLTGLHGAGDTRIDVKADGHPSAHLKCLDYALTESSLRPPYLDTVRGSTGWRVVGSYIPSVDRGDTAIWDQTRTDLGAGRCEYGPATWRCLVCEERLRSTHLPVLRESIRTRYIATQIAADMEQSAGDGGTVYRRRDDQDRGFMLGVLDNGGDLYITISGFAIPNGALHVMSRYGHVVRYVPEVRARRTAGGSRIGATVRMTATQDCPAGLFECAAPKLLHHVLVANGELYTARTEWNMTEMWIGPGGWGRYRHGDAAPSCSNCRQVIPVLLCPASGEETGVWQDV